MRNFRTILLLLPGLAFFAASQAAPQTAGHLTWEPYKLRTFDGTQHDAELGRLSVPEDREGDSSRVIQVAFVRLKSTADRPGDPVVFLAGGPGVPGSVMGRVPIYLQLFERLRAVGDVILLDQRGTGMSAPELRCPSLSLATDALETREKAETALRELVKTCAEHWVKQGVHPKAYNTAANADDIEDLRRALGADRVNLIGMSYGTTLALQVFRRYPNSVARAVLAGTQGPDDALALPSTTDAGFRRLAFAAAQDPEWNLTTPDLESLLRKAKDELAKKPTVVPAGGQQGAGKSLSVGPFALDLLIQSRMANGRGYGIIPALLETVSQGDASLLQPLAAGLYQSLGAGSNLMQYTMACSDGSSPERRARFERELGRSLLGDALNIHMQPELCQALGIVPADVSPVWSFVPTLFISGTMDSNTPAFQAERVLWGFPNGIHVVVQNGFHETLPDDRVQAIAADFLARKDVITRSLAERSPRFASVEETRTQINSPPR